MSSEKKNIFDTLVLIGFSYGIVAIIVKLLGGEINVFFDAQIYQTFLDKSNPNYHVLALPLFLFQLFEDIVVILICLATIGHMYANRKNIYKKYVIALSVMIALKLIDYLATFIVPILSKLRGEVQSDLVLKIVWLVVAIFVWRKTNPQSKETPNSSTTL